MVFYTQMQTSQPEVLELQPGNNIDIPAQEALVIGECELNQAGIEFMNDWEYGITDALVIPLELYIMIHGNSISPNRYNDESDFLYWLESVCSDDLDWGEPFDGSTGGAVNLPGRLKIIGSSIGDYHTEGGHRANNNPHPLFIRGANQRSPKTLHPAHQNTIQTRNTQYLRPRALTLTQLRDLIEQVEQNGDVAAQEIAILEGLESTDTTQTTTSRVEQRHLRRFLFQDQEIAQCWICHRLLPNAGAYIWCAHIKRRSEASEEERTDENIVAGMCKFGCDTLFERGDIVVNEAGVVQANNRESNDLPSLRAKMEELHENEVLNFSALNADYFQWHRETHQ